MSIILKPIMFLALAGFVASVVTHIAGFAGIDKPFGFNPWPLHIGIFVVWLPAVIVAQTLSKGFSQKDMWKATLRGCPKWVKYALYGLFGYAFLSFFAFIATDMGGGSEAGKVRGFSGHWMVFYFAAYAILRSAINVSASDTVRRCHNGHPVEPNDKYCSQCGSHVGSTVE